MKNIDINNIKPHSTNDDVKIKNKSVLKVPQIRRDYQKQITTEHEAMVYNNQTNRNEWVKGGVNNLILPESEIEIEQ